MKTVIFFTIVLIIMSGKWIVILFNFPFYVMYVKYLNNPSFINKVLAYPREIIEKVTRGGYERWMLYNVSLVPSCHLRRFIYKSLGCKMGDNNVFHFKTEIRGIMNLQIGNGNILGDNALLDARRGLIIGNNVVFSSNVSIYTLQHDYRSPYFSCPPEGGQVIIEDRVWFGANVIVLPGVRIGEGAVCCAGCVVTKSVAPYDVVAGIPAKKISERPKNLIYESKGRSCWFY